MAMSKQIKLYSINLGMAKTEREKQLYRMKYTNESSIYNYKCKISNSVKQELGVTEWTKDCSALFKERLKEDKTFIGMTEVNKRLIKVIRDVVKQRPKIEGIGVREVDGRNFKEVNVIAFFDNVLTRTLQINQDTPTLDFIVIEAGNTDMEIVKQVIEDGLLIKDRIKIGETEDGVDIIQVVEDKYKFFTAGAGQTRQKKFMMIKESVWDKYEKHLMCGLSIEAVNDMGGMNVNKFNAYLSLNNSASEVVEGFDIDKCIVVDDFTKMVEDEVDYITRDDEVDKGCVSYTTKSGKEVTRKKKVTEWDIERKTMEVPIDYMDGAGICTSDIFNKTTQVRLPWFKGILTPIDYKRYIKSNNLTSKVTDIYGKEYDVIEDDIKIIFTKSQFKLWKYYKNVLDEDGNVYMTGWEVYKACYKFYNCTCNKCMEDEDFLKDMRINYQMLQTLTDMTDEQIEILTKPTKDLIDRVHSSREEQLEFLGAVKTKRNRSYMQEIIRLYPEILTSKYIKRQLKDTILSFKKEAKSGRIKLKAKRVFIIPDLIHFMSNLFGDGTDYALEKNEVSFKTYKNSERLALLRSPHLSREWFLGKNTFNDKTKYFTTNGVYVSAKDLMSKVLMCDWDGDESLVVEDCEEQKWLLDLAEEQMKDLRPLYYEMGGGDSSIINSENTYKSLKFVYEKSNIGKVSNTLTNIWSKSDCDEHTDDIKKLCAYNNWIIDSAKKLELPKLPQNIRNLMTNKTYPFFFQYAKGKKRSDCRDIGTGVIDRICKSIDNVQYANFDYSKGFGKFNLNVLLSKKGVVLDNDVIEFYERLEKETKAVIRKYFVKYKDNSDFDYKKLAYDEARQETIEYAKARGVDYLDVVDIIIKYGFECDELNLAFVFNTFGAVMINNINNNVKLSVDDKMVTICELCGKRIKLKSVNSNVKYCKGCAKKENIRKTNSKDIET